MIVVVTNMGSINYVVKTGKFDWDKAAEMFEKAGREFLKKDDLKHRQKITDDFLAHCHECGLIFEDR